jgi:hypothetical protein
MMIGIGTEETCNQNQNKCLKFTNRNDLELQIKFKDLEKQPLLLFATAGQQFLEMMQ